jgi:hypothetical protein
LLEGLNEGPLPYFFVIDPKKRFIEIPVLHLKKGFPVFSELSNSSLTRNMYGRHNSVQYGYRYSVP